MARLPYLSQEDLPPDKRHIYAELERTRDKYALNAFTLLLNDIDAAEALAHLGKYLKLESPLNPQIREIAILSTAQVLDNDYMWASHEYIARKVGLRNELIESIRQGKAPMGLPAKEGIFAQAAKEIIGKGGLTDKTFQAIHHLLGSAQTIDLLLVIGYYTMMSGLLKSLAVEMLPDMKPRLPIGL